MTESWLLALESSGLICLAQTPPELEYAFRHALVHEAAYDSILKQDRQRLHLAVGEALERLYPHRLEALAPVLGRHFLAAGDARALKYFALAGDLALATCANQEAQEHYCMALNVASQPADRARLLTRLGEALVWQSRPEEAIHVWRQAIELYQALGDADGMAQLYARSARAASWAGDLPGSLQLSQAGLAAVGTTLTSPGMAALLHEMARACLFNGLPDQAFQFGHQALEVARQVNAVEAQAEALVTLGILPNQPPDQALQLLQEAARLAETNGLLATAARAHANLGAVLGDIQGDLQGARNHYLRASHLEHQRGIASEELRSLNSATLLSLWLGDLAMAAQELESSRPLLDLVGERGPGAFGFWINQAMLLRYQGERTAALEQLAACRDQARQRGDFQSVINASYPLAEILMELRQWSEAATVLMEILDLCERGFGSGSVWPRCMLCATRANQGRFEEAQHWLSVAREKAGPQPGNWDAEALALAEGRLAFAEKHWSQALAAFEVAARIEAKMGLRWYQAYTLQEYARVCLARGEPGDDTRACQALSQALAIYRALNVEHYAVSVERQLLACK